MQWRELNVVHLSEDRLEERKATLFVFGVREWDLLFLRHSAENILGHAAARGEIGPDTFPLLGCADLLFCPPHRATALHRVWDSLDTTTCARAPRKCASSWARTCFSLFSHRPRTKERFHNSGRATLAIGSDAIIRLNSVRQTRSRQAGRQAGRHLFPCQLEQFPSELNWTPRTAFTCLRRGVVRSR